MVKGVARETSRSVGSEGALVGQSVGSKTDPLIDLTGYPASQVFPAPGLRLARNMAARYGDVPTLSNLNAFFGDPAIDAYADLRKHGFDARLEGSDFNRDYENGPLQQNRIAQERIKKRRELEEMRRKFQEAGFDARVE
jgi:hypothetical protein